MVGVFYNRTEYLFVPISVLDAGNSGKIIE